MTATLLASGITLSHGSRVILSDVNLIVAPGDRVGLMGPNGVGKSTLLSVLAGALVPDSGSVELRPPTARLTLLAQEPDRDPNETVAACLARRTGIAEANTQFERATAALANGDSGADDWYANALETWLNVGAADFDARCHIVMNQLDLHERLLNLPTSALSGGQAARLGLASILLAQPDILLLDEPTNDLDFASLELLEDHLLGQSVPQLIVSHDRSFLEHVITGVIEVDPHTHSTRRFDGGWLAYLDERSTESRHAETRYNEFTNKRDALLSRAQQQRQWANTGAKRAKRKPSDGDKFIKAHNVAQTEKLASKAAATEKALERLDVVDKPWEEWQLRLELAVAPRSGDVAVAVTDLVIERGDWQLGPLSFTVGSGERVALLGANGTGKSSILHAIRGRLSPIAGEVYVGPSVVVGELMQLRSQFDADTIVLRAFQDAGGPNTDAEARTLLAKFGIGVEHIGRTTSSLSAGERTRLVLALLQIRQSNLIILDEPTNHLDVAAIEQIEQALDGYPGTVMVVTHDRAFLEALRVDRMLELRDDTLVEHRVSADL